MARNLLFNEWSETGVNAYGRVGTGAFSVNYDLAIVNGPNGDDTDDPSNGIPEILEVGTGDNPNTGGTGDARQNRDNNNNRTIIGRVSVPVKHGPHFVEVGASYGGGRYSDEDAAEDLDFSLIGVDAKFQMMGLDLRGEWVSRTADVDPVFVPVSFPDDELNSSSYYLQASYRVGFNQDGLNYIEPVIRYDFLEPDDDTDDDERTRTTLGINYSPYPHFKLMAEWQMNSEESDPDLDDDGFMVSATVDF